MAKGDRIMSKSKKNPSAKAPKAPKAKKNAIEETRAADAAANAASVNPDIVPLKDAMGTKAKGGKKTKAPIKAPAPEVNPTVEIITGQPLPPGSEPTKRAKKAKAEKPAKTPRPSGLTAAYRVLLDAGEPMQCKAMVEKVLAAGTWKTDGKTPEATIYAAIIREIRAKGAESRFRKTDRGLFEAVK
jgi:hypothetical protein